MSELLSIRTKWCWQEIMEREMVDLEKLKCRQLA
jgi:hypothetical protein